MDHVLSRVRQISLLEWIKFLVLFVIGLLMITPFLWMLSVSFERMANAVMPYPPRLIPKQFSLFNYNLVFLDGGIMKAYLHSILVTACCVVLKVCSSLLAGYAFSKGNFKGKKILFLVFLSTMMIPWEARLVSMYLMWLKVNLLNTYWPIILPSVLDAFMVFLCKQFFDELPDTLREAAQIDGAGEFSTFLSVYAPLAGPIAATAIILTFMWSWNDFLWPLIVLTDNKLQTLPLFLASFTQQYGNYSGLSMATTTLSILPVIVVFIVFQKYVIQSVALSGLKGE